MLYQVLTVESFDLQWFHLLNLVSVMKLYESFALLVVEKNILYNHLRVNMYRKLELSVVNFDYTFIYKIYMVRTEWKLVEILETGCYLKYK